PLGEDYYKSETTGPFSRRGQLTRIEHYQPQKSMGSIQQALGFRGQTQIISNACASGANAIGHAFHLIKSGQQAVALAGGYDALAQMVFAGFDALQALSESGIPRPFDANRDGLAIGEGAAMLVLESEQSMLARGADPVAEICGYGMATDLHHLTQPHPDGKAAIKSMTGACEDAGIQPSEIQYINSHGTGTPLNDVAEAHAITHWAGDHAREIMVSSTKSAMGHLLGGAGAIESVICLLALQEQMVPASLNIRDVDPACQFDLVQQPRETSFDTALTNSFGFGGCNATLIFRKS
ncbi:MAG: beta-ketoacyl-[acyl-carrier-protein] synthase family protein, partial [Verrucomicrobiae bacterium]|nr:beta-ketoacyl-[acyl-carrier-protein] synthase family protein [Verrucomicrobiae bacterium]NNJ86001.1 beta-ketoacyl-[acyl-carrier-protein] synthase family protein [Akkermansiaceae bacterium]